MARRRRPSPGRTEVPGASERHGTSPRHRHRPGRPAPVHPTSPIRARRGSPGHRRHRRPASARSRRRRSGRQPGTVARPVSDPARPRRTAAAAPARAEIPAASCLAAGTGVVAARRSVAQCRRRRPSHPAPVTGTTAAPVPSTGHPPAPRAVRPLPSTAGRHAHHVHHAPPGRSAPPRDARGVTRPTPRSSPPGPGERGRSPAGTGGPRDGSPQRPRSAATPGDRPGRPLPLTAAADSTPGGPGRPARAARTPPGTNRGRPTPHKTRRRRDRRPPSRAAGRHTGRHPPTPRGSRRAGAPAGWARRIRLAHLRTPSGVQTRWTRAFSIRCGSIRRGDRAGFRRRPTGRPRHLFTVAPTPEGGDPAQRKQHAGARWRTKPGCRSGRVVISNRLPAGAPARTRLVPARRVAEPDHRRTSSPSMRPCVPAVSWRGPAG